MHKITTSTSIRIMSSMLHIASNILASLGQWVLRCLMQLGGFALLLVQLLGHMPVIFKRPRLILQQMYVLGNQSLVIIITAGIFVGLVLALQGYYVLNRYGSSQALGVMIALSLLRELGPVMSALLFAGRAGSALSAEIGLMKAGEQLHALEMMAINPIQRILSPRFWAGFLSLPGLSLIFNAVGIMAAYVLSNFLLNIDAAAFWGHMKDGVSFTHDVLNGMIKSLVFGMLITAIALYCGYQAKATPEGVAQATTSTVIWGCLATLGADFLLTAMMFIQK